MASEALQEEDSSWSDAELEIEELEPFPKEEFEMMVAKLPKGVGLSAEFCDEILQVKLHRVSFEEVVEIAVDFTVDTLMTKLQPSLYKKYRLDIRKFLVLGILQKEMNKKKIGSVTTGNSEKWLKRFGILVALHDGDFNKKEKEVVSSLKPVQSKTPVKSIPKDKDPPDDRSQSSKPRPMGKKGGSKSGSSKKSFKGSVKGKKKSTSSTEGSEDDSSNSSSIDSKDSSSKRSKKKKSSETKSGSKDLRYAFVEPPEALEADRLERVRERLKVSTIAYSTPTKKIKGTLPVQVKWNGTLEAFPSYRDAVEGFYTQVHYGFIFDEQFQKLYKEHGWKTAEHPQLPEYVTVSVNQIQEVASHLYGAIQTSCRDSHTARRFLKKHHGTRDGILVWMDLSLNQDKDGNVNVHEMKLEQKIRRQYTRNYSGGLVQYLEDVADGFAGLDEIECIYTEKQKMHILLGNLQLNDSDQYLITHCRNHFKTFQECYNYLRDEATQCQENNVTSSKRKSNLVSFDDRTSSYGILDDRDTAAMHASASDPRFSIPTEAWDLLMNIVGKDKLKEYMEHRNAIILDPSQARVQTPTATRPPPRKNHDNATPCHDNGSPCQYGGQRKANLAVVDEENEQGSDIESMDEQGETSDDVESDSEDVVPDELADAARKVYAVLSSLGNYHPKPRKGFVGISIRANLSLGDRVAHLLKSDPQLRLMIDDNGADTFIFGDGWEIVSSTGFYANLVGFDNLIARKNHLPIVTAQTVVTHHRSGKSIIIRAHQGVSNLTVRYTLASEYQMSEGGCLVDSKARRHMRPDGSKGTQSIKFPGHDDIFEFEIRECLMTLQHRPPTEEEKETLPIIEITSKKVWNPSEHTYLCDDTVLPVDDDEALYPTLSDEDRPATALVASCDLPPDIEEPTVTLSQDPGEHIGADDDSGEEEFFDATPEAEEDEEVFSDAVETVNTAELRVPIPKGQKLAISLDSDYVLSSEVDQFLDSIDHEELTGYREKFDVNSYCIRASKELRHIMPAKARPDKENLEEFRRCLAWLPMEIIKHTLACTTRLAQWTARVPMHRHFSARFPFLNLQRLNEAVATDTYFANCRAIGGATCAQVFFGCKSKMINVYPMKSESEGPNAYEDFLREEGIPSIVHRDNAKMQTGDDFAVLNRHYLVKDGLTEPYHSHQNPAELNAVRWLKDHSQVLMNRVNSPAYTWSYAAQHLAKINNVTAHESLGWRTPKEKRHGCTPDISAYLMFEFWERIYYLDVEETYPNSREKPGHFLGVAENIGDALTFYILTDDTKQVLVRSMVHSAVNPSQFGFSNARIQFGDDLQHTEHESEEDDSVEAVPQLLR